MTRPSSSRRSGRPTARPDARTAKQTAGLRITFLAATIMVLLQIGLGYWVAASVEVPGTDQGGGIFTAIGRALSHRPLNLAAHATLGLLLILTAISAIVRGLLAHRSTMLALATIALLAVLAANVTGAKFVDAGKDTDSTVMEIASMVTLTCYLVGLYLLGKWRFRLR